ncbi:late embryogenesis abundant protein [Striga asiatica]|uniref:Late embryogenesis abundant protein n=1 Tax=Striga asiatica TaxID=4170 RepID=A0A5A7RFL3_STRAF|nr:late embryogenesis abundant protein [Striga asiatica]
MSDETGPPHHPPRAHGPNQHPYTYTRLTALEIDGPDDPLPGHRDCALVAAFATISLALILAASLLPSLGPEGPGPWAGARFALQSLMITEFRASSARISGRCHLALDVTNPGRRMRLYHENAVVMVFLDHELLWVARSSGFVLGPGERLVFNVSTGGADESLPVSDAFVPTALVEGRELGRKLRFKVKYDGMVREGLNTWREERAHVYMVCGWVEMGFVSESVVRGGPANCALENF